MTLARKPNGFELRLRYGKGQRDRFVLATLDEDLALALEPRMEAMARTLAMGADADRALLLLREACLSASDAKNFAVVERVVEKLRRERTSTAPVAAPSTFRDVVELWTSGKLREQYPDAVRSKSDRGHKIDRATLEVFFPVLAQLPLADITGQHVAEAKRLIPKDLDPDTRRLYLVRLRTTFRYGRKPLRLIATVPDEVEELPPLKKRNLFWFMYPEEDAQLLACTKIPLAYRVLYGWLNRNGTRIHETLLLDQEHLDLGRGRVRLEAAWTKTGRARFWDLEHDVHTALRAWHHLDGKPKGEARVFHTPLGKSLHQVTVAARFRADLLLAGVDRPELHLTTPGSRRLRVHDTRSSFCTMARRRGMPDTWIMDRSGHESVQQLEKYTRFVRHAAEQELAQWFAPMDQAIPELRAIVARVGQGWAKPQRESRKRALPAPSRYSMAESVSGKNQQEIPQKPTSVTAETSVWPTSGPAENKGVGQAAPAVGTSAPPSSELGEATLRRLLELATRAHDWDSVGELSAQLKALEARRAPNVSSLDAARRRREEGRS